MTFVSGLACLGVGLFVYVSARPAGIVPFLPHFGLVSRGAPDVLRSILGGAPTFMHVIAFSLMTAALSGASLQRKLMSCAAWTCINVVFELGQHTAARHWILEHTGGIGANVPLLGRYFGGTTFDPIDIIAAVAGGLVAALVIWGVNPRRKCG